MFCRFCPSVFPFVIPSVNTYISAATYQKLFIFGIGVPGRVLFHSTSMNPWVMPWVGLEVRILDASIKKCIAVCLYKLLNKEGWSSDMFITSTFSVIKSRSLWPDFHAPVIALYLKDYLMD